MFAEEWIDDAGRVLVLVIEGGPTCANDTAGGMMVRGPRPHQPGCRMGQSWTIKELFEELERFEHAARRAGLAENSVRTYVDRSRIFVRWLAGVTSSRVHTPDA